MSIRTWYNATYYGFDYLTTSFAIGVGVSLGIGVMWLWG